jgi:hypothetical protein
MRCNFGGGTASALVVERAIIISFDIEPLYHARLLLKHSGLTALKSTQARGVKIAADFNGMLE